MYLLLAIVHLDGRRKKLISNFPAHARYYDLHTTHAHDMSITQQNVFDYLLTLGTVGATSKDVAKHFRTTKSLINRKFSPEHTNYEQSWCGIYKIPGVTHTEFRHCVTQEQTLQHPPAYNDEAEVVAVMMSTISIAPPVAVEVPAEPEPEPNAIPQHRMNINIRARPRIVE